MCEKFYQSCLATRYASKEMKDLFSEHNKIISYRKLWIYFARALKELDMGVNDEQIKEMEKNLDKIDYEAIKTIEIKTRHKLFANVDVFAKQCPLSKDIIRGTSFSFLANNADLIVMQEALKLLLSKILAVIEKLSEFSLNYSSLPTLELTDSKDAQLTTVGKRATLWVYDLMMDENNLRTCLENLNFCGLIELHPKIFESFKDDLEKIKQLDTLLTNIAGFKKSYSIIGRTYSRKVDLDIISTITSLGASIHKICTDLRLLASMKEIEEPLENIQFGSSKQNPMKSERCCNLARHLITLHSNAVNTYTNQWLERTYDDSANRRISISEVFLTADACLLTLLNISEGPIVYPKIIENHVAQELPFMATENIISEMEKSGIDRQECHERIKILSHEASNQVKIHGKKNDLIDRIKNDSYFKPIINQLDLIMDPKSFTGRASQQVVEFYEEEIKPLLEKYDDEIKRNSHSVKLLI